MVDGRAVTSEEQRDEPAVATGPDPASVDAGTNESGLRRRGYRALAIGVGMLVVVVVVGLLTGGVLGGGDQLHGRDASAPPAERAHEMSGLAKRALAEVPGATRVSDWQIVLPTPGAQPLTTPRLAGHVIGRPIATGAHDYAAVTSYPHSAFPPWLYRGVQRIERGSATSATSATSDTDLLVDTGEVFLGCVGPSAARCRPAYLTRSSRGWVHQRGLGTEAFLTPVSPMQVFTSEDYSTGSPGQLVVAGLAGTDVARADLITATGETVSGHVEPGTVVPGGTMVWGRVPGTLAAVMTYDASGDLVEAHQLRPCGGPEDCDVR